MLSPSFFRTFRGKSGPCLQFFLQPQPEICKRMHFQYPPSDYNASQCTTEVPFSISIRFWLDASCPSGVLHRVALPRKNCPTEVGPPLRQRHRQCVVRMWLVTRSIAMIGAVVSSKHAGTNHAERCWKSRLWPLYGNMLFGQHPFSIQISEGFCAQQTLVGVCLQ